MNADATNIIQITHDDGDHEDPAWSPDGRNTAPAMCARILLNEYYRPALRPEQCARNERSEIRYKR
jgi:WD40-like Beta Propeller Repeat